MADAFIIETDIQRFQAAMRRAPGVMERNIGRAIRSSLNRIARNARLAAPKFRTTLASSIMVTMINQLEGVTGPSTNYGEFAERGSGPGGYPPLQDMIDWVQTKNIQSADPDMSVRDLAFIIRRSIGRKGTPAQPYLIPAAEQYEAQTRANIDQAIDRALSEIART